jgi:hypothetical protein
LLGENASRTEAILNSIVDSHEMEEEWGSWLFSVHSLQFSVGSWKGGIVVIWKNR